MEISERIKQRMQALKLKAVNLVKLTGVSKGTVSQWVNGITNPSGQNLISLCSALQCSPAWLLTGEDDSYKKPSHNTSIYSGLIGSFDLWDSETPINDDEVALPFFKEVELAAGNGSTLVQEDTSFKLRFAKSTLRKLDVNPSDAACVTVSGNSMEPALNNGATVGVDTSKKTIVDGKMYAVDHNGMLRVKILYRQPNGGVKLRSFNIDEYQDEVVDYSDIRIIGRVFWSSNFH